MEEINNEIFNEIQDYLPKEWDSVVYYALYTSDSYSMKYFVKKDNEYIDCFDLFTDDELLDLFKRLNTIIQNFKEDLKESNKWTSMVLTVNSDGKFKTDYNYLKLDDISVKYEQSLKDKYLK